MSTGAYFTSADDLASVPSDWIAGRRTQLDVVIDGSQTAAWQTHLLPEVSSHC
jgi:hypothetical protein